MSTKNREKAWSEFVSWCRVRGLKALPAHPWTLAAYARWCEPRHKYAHIVARVRAIARAHLLACTAAPDRHPTVTRTLRTIEIRQRTKGQRSALFGDDIAVPATAPAKPKLPRGTRRPRGLRQGPRLVSRRPSST